MSNLIELEAGYKLNDFENILKKIKEYDYKLNYKVTEQDTYYTDKDLEFIKNRICLRTRKVNNESLELTFKPRSDANTEKYGKKEVNIQLKVEDLEDIKFIIKNLGYDEYVSFIKHRTVYSKEEFGFEHNMIFAMTIVGIAYIIHIIKKVKMMSISNSYTYPRVIKILTNLIIMNSITPNQNKYSHKNHKISTKA